MKKRKVKKAPFVILIILITLIFGSLYVFKGAFEKNKDDKNPDILEKEEPKDKVYNVSFTLGGNVLINSNMWYDRLTSDGYDFDGVFEDLNDIMKKSDINFYYQQSMVGGKELGTSFNYDYNSPNEVPASLAKLGFNAVSLASRHSYDKGITGITNTIKTILDNKFIYAGINDTIDNRLKNNIIEKNGLKIALLSYTTSTDVMVQTANSVDLYSDDLVKTDVESIKDEVDVIMVSIDWSNIVSDVVTEEQKRIANYLESLGVDIIVGDTGYVIQPIEKINDTLVCYPLGNLLSGHYAVDSRISAMVDFNLKVTKSLTDKKLSFEDINVLLTYAYNYDYTMYKVIPFTKLTNELLDHKSYYNKYNELLTKANPDIKLYSIGE